MKLIDLLPGRVAGLALVAGALITAIAILVLDSRGAVPSHSRLDSSAETSGGALVFRHTVPVSGRN